MRSVDATHVKDRPWCDAAAAAQEDLVGLEGAWRHSVTDRALRCGMPSRLEGTRNLLTARAAFQSDHRQGFKKLPSNDIQKSPIHTANRCARNNPSHHTRLLAGGVPFITKRELTRVTET